MPTSPEVCACTTLGNMKCQTELLTQNKVYIWLINWSATNMTGSYCLSKVTCVTSHHLYYSVCSKCPPPARTQARRHWHHLLTAHSIIEWPRAAHSTTAVDALFQFVNIRDLGTIYSLLKHTPHSVVNQIEIKWVRGQRVGGIKSGVSSSSSATVSLVQCDRTLSCWKMKNSFPGAAQMSVSSIWLKTTSQ